MSDITLTAAMRANLLSLQSTQTLLGQTQLRLATGNKVNSALDNPVNFFAAQTLNNRASDLGSLLDGMGQAIQVLKTTDQAITSLTKQVQQLKSIANSAKSAASSVSSVNVLGFTDADDGIDSLGVADLTDSNTARTGGEITVGDGFTLQNGTGPAHSFIIGDPEDDGGVGITLQSVVDAINATDGFQASIVYGDGSTDLPDGSEAGTIGLAYLKITSTTGEAITAADLGTNTGNGVLDSLGLDTDSAAVATSDLTTYTQSYADVITQINQTVLDANYQGSNLIDGSGTALTVQVNEKGDNDISVANKDLSQTGLGLDALATSWDASDLTTIDASITKIEAALATLRTTSSSFSNSLSLIQTRQDFTTNLINTLKDGASQLTIADKNEEGANMLALQTAQQLGIQSLSLASQANQSVLRLFA